MRISNALTPPAIDIALPIGLLATMLLAACAPFPPRAGTSSADVDSGSIPDAVPHQETRSKYGNPSSYVVDGHRYHVLPACRGYDKRGIASWYGSKFHGRRTSSGESYNMNAMTAAHKTLPLPCYVRVTNLKNGKSIVVKVNDRGPFVKNRLIDLSHVAASKLGIIGTGTGLVEVQSIDAKLAQPAVVTAAYAAPTSAAPALDTLHPLPPSTADIDPAIYLQVGAFAERANADQIERRLRATHIKHVTIKADSIDNRTLYRVRIGPVAGVSATDDLSDRLVRNGFGVPQVVIISQPLAKR